MRWFCAYRMKCPLIAAFLFSLSAFADGGEGRVIHHDGGSLVFNSSGVLTIAANDVAVSRFVYDGDRRVTAADMLFGTNYFAFAFLRDAGGLVTNITYDVGKSVSRTYDLSGRLARVTDWLGHSWTFQYDALGRSTRLTYPTGIEKVCTYDAAGRLASWRVGTIQGRTMTYDAAGRRISDRIDFGPMPNVTSQKQTGTYNAADQLVSGTKTQAGTTCDEQFAHNRNGAMTNIVSAGITTRTFAYNSRGQFAGLTENGETVTCAYDAMGNRIRIGESILVPDFTDSLSRPLCETTTSAAKYYIWANNELLGVIAADGTFIVTHCDNFSSVIAHSDASGNLLSNVVYGPHGEIWRQTGTPLTFRWLGGYGVRQMDNGLCLTQHRLYDSVRQRFLSSDPMGIDGGFNLYAYGNCNPVDHSDPTGLCSDFPADCLEFLKDSYSGVPNLIRAGFDFFQSTATYQSEWAFEQGLRFEAVNYRALARGSRNERWSS